MYVQHTLMQCPKYGDPSSDHQQSPSEQDTVRNNTKQKDKANSQIAKNANELAMQNEKAKYNA